MGTVRLEALSCPVKKEEVNAFGRSKAIWVSAGDRMKEEKPAVTNRETFHTRRGQDLGAMAVQNVAHLAYRPTGNTREDR